MKVTITACSDLELSVLLEETAVRFYKQVGLVIGVGVPVLFWTTALALAGYAIGVAIGPQALMDFGLIIGAFSFMAARVLCLQNEHAARTGGGGSGRRSGGCVPQRLRLMG